MSLHIVLLFICLLTCPLFHPLYPSSYLPTLCTPPHTFLPCLIIAHPPIHIPTHFHTTSPHSHQSCDMATLKKYPHWLSSPTSVHTYTTSQPQKGEPSIDTLLLPFILLTITYFTPSYSHHPEKWLQLMATHPLEKLVYIDIDFGYQYLRVEFCLPGACYSFLMRDEEKCTTCSSRLACEIPPSNITSNAKKISS